MLFGCSRCAFAATALLAASFLGLGGCATIIHGSSQAITVTSVPGGARFTVDGQGSYTTPTSVKLARKQDHVLVFEMDGYRSEQVTIMHVISGAVAGNILLGGLIGWGVDAISGAQYRLVPETVSVQLAPLRPGERPSTVHARPLTPEERLVNLRTLQDQGLITEKEYEAMRKKIIESLTD